MRPRTLFTAGGGRHNATMMHMLAERTGISIRPVNALGWNGDALERSGENTSELQSLMRTSYTVFCLKKKKTNRYHMTPAYITTQVHETSSKVHTLIRTCSSAACPTNINYTQRNNK